ncbi:MAG: hypothetical protein RLZZ28_1070 [Bacteroidota bacterium]
MKLVKLVLFSIVALFVIVCFIGILLPSKVLVSRAVNITADKDSIMPLVRNIHEWGQWMEGLDNASGQVYSDTHARLGNTEVKIGTVTETSVVSTWVNQKQQLQTSSITFIQNPHERLTIVQWQFEQELAWYPWERLGSMMNDKILGTMMEKNLNKLKARAEKNR